MVVLHIVLLRQRKKVKSIKDNNIGLVFLEFWSIMIQRCWIEFQRLLVTKLLLMPPASYHLVMIKEMNPLKKAVILPLTITALSKQLTALKTMMLLSWNS